MILKARWILPIDRPPLSPGWLEVQDGTIARVEHGRAPAGARDLGDVALLPGLVNAHTHLELSWLAGAIPRAPSLVEWIRALLAARAAAPASGQDRRMEAVRQAVETLKATGTVLVGDVSNTLTTGDILRDAGIGGVIFHELIGFSVPESGGVRPRGLGPRRSDDRRFSRRVAGKPGGAARQARQTPGGGRPGGESGGARALLGLSGAVP